MLPASRISKTRVDSVMRDTKENDVKLVSTVQRRKWSPTANDPQTGNEPQIGPQMIPDEDRKWSLQKTRKGMEFGFLDFLLFLFYFYISLTFLSTKLLIR